MIIAIPMGIDLRNMRLKLDLDIEICEGVLPYLLAFICIYFKMGSLKPQYILCVVEIN